MQISVLGVPNSAGAYCVGVEDAPTALRAAGLLGALADAGHEVTDAGDITRRLWAPDSKQPRVQNLAAEVEAAGELRDAAAPLLHDGQRLVVLGGSCTVAVGVCAAMAHSGRTPRLIYVDRHFDLNTPESTLEGSLSWMGMAHALGLPGAARDLVELSGDGPLLQPADLVYLGVGPSEITEWEVNQQQSLGISVIPQEDLVGAPTKAAESALRANSDGGFFVHLDVDVLDFMDAPLAENVNGRNTGPSIDQLGQALQVLWQDPQCIGLSIGQLVPAHAASDPTVLPRFVTMLAEM